MRNFFSEWMRKNPCFEEVQFTDHRLTKWLKERKALDHVTSVGKSNRWHDPTGLIVAVVIYSGPGGLATKRYIRKEEADDDGKKQYLVSETASR